MAQAKDAKKDEPKKGGSSIVMMMVVLILGLGIGGGGAWFMAGKAAKASTTKAADDEHGGGDEHAEAAAEDEHGGGDAHGGGGAGGAIYVGIDPALVVNLEDVDAVRYLQVEMQVQTKKSTVEDAIKLHMPAIRNALLMLMSEQDYRELLKVTGKEKLRSAALAEVRRVLKEQAGIGGIDNLYFTSFVSQ